MPCIGKLSSETLTLHTQALLLKIHVISGWNIPDNDDLLTILQDQFYHKLIEDYSHVNINEIEFAFRKYGTQLKDWGKKVNLNLIDTVMNDYLKARKELSLVEERASFIQIEKPKPTDDQLLQMKREVVQMKYDSFLKGISSFSLMPESGLATLALDGFCQIELYEDFLDKAFQSIQKRMQDDIDSHQQSFKMALAKELGEKKESLEANDVAVIALAKKMAFVYCFYRFKEAGYEKIYEMVETKTA